LAETIPDVNSPALTGKPYAGHLVTLSDLTIIPNGGNFGDIGGSVNQQSFTIVHNHTNDNGEDSMVMFFDARNYAVPYQYLGTQVPSGRVNVTGLIQVFGSVTTGTAELLPMSITPATGTTASGQVFWVPGGTVGGNGAWNNTAFNWNSNSTGTGIQGQFNSNSFAAFGGPAGTVTIDGAGITSNGVEFDSTGYTVTGGTLTLGNNSGSTNNNTIGVVNAGDSATISAPITGSTGLQKVGPGTLVLTGSNSYTGGVKVSEGKLSVKSDANLGDSGNFIKLSGGTLVVSPGGDMQIDANNFALSAAHNLQGLGGGIDVGDGHTLTVNGPVTMAGGLTLPNNNETILFTNAIVALGGLNFNNTGTVTVGAGGSASMFLSGKTSMNATTGTSTIQASSYKFGYDTTNGNPNGAGATISVPNAGATIAFTGSLDTASAPVTAGTRLVVNGAGTIDLPHSQNAALFNRAFQIGTAGAAGPTLNLYSDANMGGNASDQTFFNSGTLKNLSGNDMHFTTNVKFSLGGTGGFPTVIDGNSHAMTFDGAVSLFRPASGQVQISVPSSTVVNFAGGWSTTNTTTQIGDGGTFGNTSGFAVSGGGTLNMSAGAGNFTLLTVPVVADGATVNFNGTDPNNDGAQVFATGSTTVFTTANMSLGAKNGGKLNLQAANAFAGSGATPAPAKVALGGGTLGTGGFAQSFGALTVSSTGSALDVGGGAATVAFADSSGATWAASGLGTLLRINNWVSGSSHITFAGTGLGGSPTTGQLSQIHFTGYQGTAKLVAGELLPSTTTILTRGDITVDSPTPIFNSADLTAMESALADPTSYETSHGFNDADLLDVVDVNRDGVFNNGDLQAEIYLLRTGNLPGPSPAGAAPVPEPSTLVLGMLGLVLVGSRTLKRRTNMPRIC
jgi:fibronectin-binding autotransporter adhesin